MTEASFVRIFKTWQKRLGLDRWDIEIQFDHPDMAPAEVHATIEPHEHYDIACVKVAPDWRSWDRKHTNRVCLHELFHAYLREIDEVVHRLIDDNDEFARETYLHAQEGTVEALAQLLLRLQGEV